jgi:hypothetical protein
LQKKKVYVVVPKEGRKEGRKEGEEEAKIII